MKQLYFAYGSNMNWDRISTRCPGVVKFGTGLLERMKVVERKYADLEEAWGMATEWGANGVLYEITDEHLKALDKYEGFPKTYYRFRIPVYVPGLDEWVVAWVYKMTPAKAVERGHMIYSKEYREICSIGACENGLVNVFELTED